MMLPRCGSPRAILFTALLFTLPSLAQADLRVCNQTSSRVGIAIGYKAAHDWTTEGWWTVEADNCATLLPGPLSGRFYYMYAVDYEQGGEWGGDTAYFCVREKEFTIQGVNDCVARGYQRTGFYEVDTRNQENWTIQLTEPASRVKRKDRQYF